MRTCFLLERVTSAACSALLSLGLKALGAPERITLRSSVHLFTVNKVHFWRRSASRLHFFGRSWRTKGSNKCPISLRSLALSLAWQRPSRWWWRTAPGGFKPISCCRKCILCGTDVCVCGGGAMVDASPESRRGLFWVWTKLWWHI